MEPITTALDEIEENFLSCSICIQHLKEPKVLPCLHRYCSDCLDSYIKQQQQGKLECPQCRDLFTIPPEGFKTDYAVKSIVEYVHRKRSVTTDVIKHGYIGCVNHCFERNGHLCQACYLWHQNNNVAKEVRRTVATPGEISLKVNDNSLHVQRFSSDCVINDIRILAEKERMILREKLEVAIGKRKSFYNIPSADKLIKGNVAYKKILSYQYACLRQKIQDEIVKFDVALEELETVIFELRIIVHEGNQWHAKMLTNLTKSMQLGHNNKRQLIERLLVVQENYEDCKKRVKQNQDHEILNDLRARAYEIIKRYDELERSASEIIKSKDDWSVVEDFPEVCKSLDNLDEDMGKICNKLQNEILLKLKIYHLGTYHSENKIKLVTDSLAEYHRAVLSPRFKLAHQPFERGMCTVCPNCNRLIEPCHHY
ncbi:putative tripartite motif containing 56 [Apostichopus japonicus]|uniref:Putative tripartite motif containing 56 n=1 Tax=Stichopus japonicus TaxID=307972 RepID=A0A2G8L1X6_STIJA|nr:putative tripartite motif containing 56 [Apostichopus japonicus]